MVKGPPDTNDVGVFDGVENGHVFRVLSFHPLADQLLAYLCVCVCVCACVCVYVCNASVYMCGCL